METKKEGSAWKYVDGEVKGRSQSVWFTNLDHDKRHQEIIPVQNYTPEDFPRYDNYDAIEVSKISDIPINYEGVMGVPITFLDKYNPEQFEIIDINPHFFMHERPDTKPTQLKIAGRNDPYARILIRPRNPQT